MLLFYVRHGDPIYEPDSLTEQGVRQAEVLVNRMKRCNPSKIFASSSNRAMLTAKPTCDALGVEMEVLDWCNESHAASTFWYRDEKGSFWMFGHPVTKPLLASNEVRTLDREWYTHPFFAEKMPHLKKGIDRIQTETDAFMLSLGYRHVENGYIAERPNNDRIALFAHAGFGLAFMSALLDIPYPMMSTRFDIGHTGMTVVEFSGNGLVIPRVLQFSNDSHIFASDLPTAYNNSIQF
jgi:probable phosphoglycerate mutase